MGLTLTIFYWASAPPCARVTRGARAWRRETDGWLSGERGSVRKVPLASIPSPGRTVWHLGPLSVRAYALCVIAGIIVAVAVASRRYRRSGGRAIAHRGVILDVAAWAIPFGLAGALVHAILLDNRHAFGGEYRLWHAATVSVAAIGVPGAVALGAAGAWIACRRAGIRLGPGAAVAAPAVAFGLVMRG